MSRKRRNWPRISKRCGCRTRSTALRIAGSWIANCGQKPSFLLDRAKAHPGLRMLYVDVDARFRRWPTLAESFQEDLLVHRRRGRELLSGTLLLRTNTRMHRLLEIWGSLAETDAQAVGPARLAAGAESIFHNVETSRQASPGRICEDLRFDAPGPKPDHRALSSLASL